MSEDTSIPKRRVFSILGAKDEEEEKMSTELSGSQQAWEECPWLFKNKSETIS